MTPTEINASSCNKSFLFLFYFIQHSVHKMGKIPFLHTHSIPLKPINRIYGWMNVFLILSSVILTKLNIKNVIFENILFH